MKQWKIAQKLTVLVYSIGVLCVVLLGIGYFLHSTEITNPNAMLPMTQYEACVVLLLFGQPFLIAACVMLCVMFPRWPLSKKLLVFLPVLAAAAIVAFDFGISVSSSEEPHPRFQVAVTLNTEEELYAVSGNLYLDGDIIGGETCCEAGNRPLKNGDTIYLSIYPDNVPEGHELSELTMSVSVATQSPDHGTFYEVENGTVTATQWEETVSLTVTGSVEQGFEAER